MAKLLSTPSEIWQNSGFNICLIPSEYESKNAFFVILGFAFLSSTYDA